MIFGLSETKTTIVKKDPMRQLFWLMLISALFQITVSAIAYNWLDLGLFYYWAQGLFGGFFNAYDGHVTSLDYPPGYFGWLYFIGALDQIIPMKVLPPAFPVMQMTLKFFPIVFNLLCALLIFNIAKHFANEKTGLTAAKIWLFNPAILINCVWWGQIDTVLIFLLMLSFFMLEKNRPYLATAIIAISCITKFQTAFFLPVFVAAILFKQPIKKTLLCGLLGIGICYGAFVPFMIAHGGPLLPYTLYSNSYGSYPYIDLYAYNIYGIFNLNMVKEAQPIIKAFPLLTYRLFSSIVMMVSFISPFVIYIINKYRKAETDFWVASVLVMQTIFMLATKMHERYQIVVLPFLLILFLKYRDKRWIYLFSSVSVILAISELQVMCIFNSSIGETWWKGSGGNTIQTMFSIINVLVFLLSIRLCAEYLFKGQGKLNKKILGGQPDEYESVDTKIKTK